MKYLLVILASLMLSGCGSAMTRLLPKLEKIELPEELMKPPQELKTIQKPEPPQQSSTLQPETAMNNRDIYKEVDMTVDKIKSVGLNAAYVSIEEENQSDLVTYLQSRGISTQPAHWNHPEGIYIGSNKQPKNLVVLSLQF